MEKRQIQEPGSVFSYTLGFALSIALTFAAYFSVSLNWLTGRPLEAWLVGLALAQAAGQLLFFLHLGKEAPPRWKLVVFGLMGLVVCILVFGTLWIMHNLNDNMMGS